MLRVKVLIGVGKKLTLHYRFLSIRCGVDLALFSIVFGIGEIENEGQNFSGEIGKKDYMRLINANTTNET